MGPEGDGRVNGVVASTSGRFVAAFGDRSQGSAPAPRGGVVAWDTRARARVELAAYAPTAFAPDTDLLACCEGNDRIRFFDPATGKLARAPLPGLGWRVTALAFSRDSTSIWTSKANVSARFIAAVICGVCQFTFFGSM